MREISSCDRAIYSSLCAINLALLSVTCWLMSWTAFFIIGAFILGVCVAIDLVMVAIRAETATRCWHIFMLVIATLGTVAMSIYTGIECTHGDDNQSCNYMIGSTIMAAVISVMEVVILKWGERVGYGRHYCCLTESQKQKQIYPVETMLRQTTTHKPTQTTTKAVVFVVPVEHIK